MERSAWLAGFPLISLLLGSGPLAHAECIDEPRPLLLVPAPTEGEVIEIQPIIHAGPSLKAAMRPRVMRDRGPFWTLGAGIAWGGYAMIFSEHVSGPLATASLGMTFGSGRVRHGLRFGGYYGKMEGSLDELFAESEEVRSRIMGFNLGYLLQAGGFFVIAGWGAFNVSSKRPDGSKISTTDSSRPPVTLPEGVLALGYDFSLSPRLALRLQGEVGTLAVSWRGQVGIGLVLRP